MRERSIFVGARLCVGVSCAPDATVPPGDTSGTEWDAWGRNRCVSHWITGRACALCPVCDVYVREIHRLELEREARLA